MKFMVTWALLPGSLKEAANRFLAGQGKLVEGITLLGRWHKADLSGGFALVESNNPGALYEEGVIGADLLEFHIVPVIEDADAGPILAKVFKK